MEQFIRISNINDFLFCPRSLYLQGVFESYNESLYHQSPQIIGRQNHAAIDGGHYSSSKHILQGRMVSSVEYGLVGRIDVYDSQKMALIERKTKIRALHEGYRLQLYAQYVCMKEMGYNVLFLYLHSMSDNKRHAILPPNKDELKRLKQMLNNMRKVAPSTIRHHSCGRCTNHIYESLGW